MAKLSATSYERNIEISQPNDDLSAEEWVEMFFGAMVGITFLPVTILNAMKDFAEEQLPYVGEKDEDFNKI